MVTSLQFATRQRIERRTWRMAKYAGVEPRFGTRPKRLRNYSTILPKRLPRSGLLYG